MFTVVLDIVVKTFPTMSTDVYNIISTNEKLYRKQASQIAVLQKIQWLLGQGR